MTPKAHSFLIAAMTLSFQIQPSLELYLNEYAWLDEGILFEWAPFCCAGRFDGGGATTAGNTVSANVKSLEDSMARRSFSESIITLTCLGSRQ